MNLYDNKEDLKTIIINTSEKLGLMEAIIEKDFYSMMFLKRLVEYDNNIIFKGGTSLSKCHKIISRYSEDIDLNYNGKVGDSKRKSLKKEIQKISEEMNMNISNLDETRSRRDFNRSRCDSNLSMDRINTKSSDDLYLITPQYLKPYLSFVHDNKKIFKLMYFKNEVFNGRNMYEDWLNKIFKPILSKFNVKNEEEQSYIMLFHLQGLIGLIMEWVKNDCKMPIDDLISVIQKCIKTPN